MQVFIVFFEENMKITKNRISKVNASMPYVIMQESIVSLLALVFEQLDFFNLSLNSKSQHNVPLGEHVHVRHT